MKNIIARLNSKPPRKHRNPVKKKIDWVGEFLSLMPMLTFAIMSVMLMFYMNEMDRQHKIEKVWYSNTITELQRQLNEKPKEIIVEKKVEIPKVVEKVIEKKVKVENTSKILELRRIIIDKNREIDALNDRRCK